MGDPYRTASRPELAVPDHRGERQPGADYWHAPAPEVGTVLSAWSNQTKDGFVRRGVSPGIVVLLIAIFGPFVAAFTYVGYLWIGLGGSIGAALACTALLGFLYYESKQRPWCNYLGDEGFADHRITWRGERHMVVRFSKVAAFYRATTENYTNGVYQNTQHVYRWCDRAGGELAVQKFATHDRGAAAWGARVGSRGNPNQPEADFAEAVAVAWGERRLTGAIEELDEHGVAVFPMQRGRYFSVRRGAIETDAGGSAVTLTPYEISKIGLDQGVVTIKPKQGKKIRFALSEVSDHLVALVLAKRFANVHLDGD